MMTIKKSTAAEKNQKIQRVQAEIKNLLNHQILDEAPELKQKIQELLTQASNITFKNTNANMLEGKVATQEEILQMIIDSSGYTKWKLDNTEVISSDEVKSLKDTYNIDFKDNTISRYMFTRSTRDRNALGMIIVTVLPGLFQVDLHTDRVGYDLPGLVNVKQFEQGIAAESDN